MILQRTIYRCFIALVLLACACVSYAQSESVKTYFEGLTQTLNKATNDKSRLVAIENITRALTNADSINKYADMQLELARKTKNISSEANAIRYLGKAAYKNKNAVKSIEYLFDALSIADSISDAHLMARCYRDLGDSYRLIMKGSTAANYYYKALDIVQQFDDFGAISDIYRGISGIYIDSEMFSEATKCLNKAREIDEEHGLENELCSDYLELGLVSYTRYGTDMYYHRCDSLLESAKQDFLRAYHMADKLDDSFCKYKACYRIASTMFLQMRGGYYNTTRRQQMVDSCTVLMKECHKIVDNLEVDDDWLRVGLVDGQYLLALGRYDQDKMHLDSIVERIRQEPAEVYWKDMPLAYRGLLEYYLTIGDSYGAFKILGLLRESEHRNMKIDFMVDAAQSLAQAEFDNKMKIREIEEERKAGAARVMNVAMGIVLLLVMIIAFLSIRFIRKQRRNNLLLDSKNAELENQNELLATINRDLSDSINYASVIQKAVMPSEAAIEQIWGDNVVALRPLRVVSGDFYWTAQVEQYKLLVVGDCTGHGVPGAFISMLGINILETLSARTRENAIDAAYMLNEVRRIFIHSLNKNAEKNEKPQNTSNVVNDELFNIDSRDGIDMALVIVNSETLEAHFAGAFRPMLIVREGKVITIAGDRMPVGQYVKDQAFTDHTIQLQNNDYIYLYTDGITDQFGYDENQKVVKYGQKRLHNFIGKIYDMPFKEQKKRFGVEFAHWRKKSTSASDTQLYEQTDDALIVGVKV